MKIRAIITGVTGMVGEGVLMECLQHPDVEAVLIVNRRPSGFSHPKLKELVHADFFNLFTVEAQLTGYNACYFCLGISSLGVSREEYKRTTFDLTMNFARLLAKLNPATTFCYVSGAGTDTSEQGRIAWARVKGATENALIRLLPSAYAFRPGFMKPTEGQKNIKSFFRWIAWMYPLGRKLFPGGFCTLKEVGLAMINVAVKGYPKHILEVKDIVAIAAGKIR